VLTELEVKRRWPGATASALRNYRRFLFDPAHRLWDERYGCGVEECCPDPQQLRSWLDSASRKLPRRDRRAFVELLNRLDDGW
jgi:hypothetical protein